MRGRVFAYLVAVVAAVPLLAACGGAGANALAGTRWRLVAIEQAGARQAPLAGTQLTAEFASGKISGRSGCNSYGGDYTAGGSSIAVGELAQTLMGCEQPVMDQEAQFLNALKSATAFTIAGSELRIEYAGGMLVFAAA